MPAGPQWHVYILRCADGSLYTGITTDLARRLAEHNQGGALGARYTRSRRPVELIYSEEAESRSAAAKREAALKKLDRAAKLDLAQPETAFDTPINQA
jgi:putative endonuclease